MGTIGWVIAAFVLGLAFGNALGEWSFRKYLFLAGWRDPKWRTPVCLGVIEGKRRFAYIVPEKEYVGHSRLPDHIK